MLCPHCLLDGLDLRSDKKGRPWWYCTECKQRTFPRGGMSVAIFSTVSELLSNNPETVMKIHDAAQKKYRAMVKDRMGKGKGSAVKPVKAPVGEEAE